MFPEVLTHHITVRRMPGGATSCTCASAAAARATACNVTLACAKGSLGSHGLGLRMWPNGAFKRYLLGALGSFGIAELGLDLPFDSEL